MNAKTSPSTKNTGTHNFPKTIFSIIIGLSPVILILFWANQTPLSEVITWIVVIVGIFLILTLALLLPLKDGKITNIKESSPSYWFATAWLAIILYIPSIEIAINKLLMGNFNGFQKSLIPDFYLSFIPTSVALMVAIGLTKTNIKKDYRSYFFWVTFIFYSISVVPQIIKNGINPTSIGLAFVGLAFLVYIASASKNLFSRITKIVIALFFIGISAFYHVQNYRDFFANPIKISNATATVNAINSNGKGATPTISFTTKEKQGKAWSFRTKTYYPKNIEEVSNRLRNEPINIYYTPNLNTLVRIEDAKTGEALFER